MVVLCVILIYLLDSVGAILYVMLCGFCPFEDGKSVSIFEQIKRGLVEFPEQYWTKISYAGVFLYTMRCLLYFRVGNVCSCMLLVVGLSRLLKPSACRFDHFI